MRVYFLQTNTTYTRRRRFYGFRFRGRRPHHEYNIRNVCVCVLYCNNCCLFFFSKSVLFCAGLRKKKYKYIRNSKIVGDCETDTTEAGVWYKIVIHSPCIVLGGSYLGFFFTRCARRLFPFIIQPLHAKPSLLVSDNKNFFGLKMSFRENTPYIILL